MIRTLLRHESLRTRRWLGALTAGALAVVGLMAAMGFLMPRPVGSLFAGIGVAVAVAYPFAVQLYVSLDFYRSCYSKTGYFTAAIPARGSTIFRVKACHAYLASLVALVFDLLLLALAFIGFNGASGIAAGATLDSMREAVSTMEVLPAWVKLCLVVAVALLPLTGIAPYFFAATIGSEAWINRTGFAGVVLVWFLFYTASQILGLLVILLLPTLDLTSFPEVSVMYDPVALLHAGESSSYLPLGVFFWMLAIGVVGMWQAQVSYSRRLELR